MKIPPLFEDQKISLAFEEKNNIVFDMSEPGTGKTRVRLEAFAKRRARKGGCALVIAPKSILDVAWQADCEKYTPWLKVVCAYAENREEAFNTDADIYVTNHDAVKWLAKQKPAFFKRFDTLIIDESGAFKHHTSQRSKAINKIKIHFKVRIAMNGTPMAISVLDVWHQAFIIDDGKRLGKSFYAFRSAVCTPEQQGRLPNMVKWVDKEGAETVVADLLKDISLRHVLQNLPENRNYKVLFKMPAKQHRAYLEMEKTAILQVKKGEIRAINAASVRTKLLQIASGAVYESEDTYHVIDDARYKLIADLVEARKFCVVFFEWKHQRDLLIKEFKARDITYTIIDGDVKGRKQRREAVQHFQGGFYKVVLAHRQSAAHGLTLTKGTSTIWASPTPNLEHWLQGNKRIHRSGQTEKTETINVLAKGTIEEHVYDDVLMGRKDSLESFFSYLEGKQ